MLNLAAFEVSLQSLKRGGGGGGLCRQQLAAHRLWIGRRKHCQLFCSVLGQAAVADTDAAELLFDQKERAFDFDPSAGISTLAVLNLLSPPCVADHFHR